MTRSQFRAWQELCVHRVALEEPLLSFAGHGAPSSDRSGRSRPGLGCPWLPAQGDARVLKLARGCPSPVVLRLIERQTRGMKWCWRKWCWRKGCFFVGLVPHDPSGQAVITLIMQLHVGCLLWYSDWSLAEALRVAPSSWSYPHSYGSLVRDSPWNHTPFFSRMELVLHPQSWVLHQTPSGMEGRSSHSIPGAPAALRMGATAGHPPEHCPGCWFSAPGGRLWNCSSSRHLCVFPCWKTVCESFLCGEGRISPLWTDLLTFSSEPAESHELKGGSPVEACGENLIRAYLALTHQAEHGQAEQNIQSYI